MDFNIIIIIIILFIIISIVIINIFIIRIVIKICVIIILSRSKRIKWLLGFKLYIYRWLVKLLQTKYQVV